MRLVLSILSLAVPAAIGQTGTASIAGIVLDAKTQKPIPAALVMAAQRGAPLFTKNTKTGGDGAFCGNARNSVESSNPRVIHFTRPFSD